MDTHTSKSLGFVPKGLAVISIAVFLLGLAATGAAQPSLIEMNTAMSMSDTLMGASSPSPSGYFAPGAFGTAPGVPGAPMLGMPGAPMPGAAMGGPYGMTPFPGAPMPGIAPGVQPPLPAVKKILVLTGERVTCHVMGTLLEDIHYEYRPEAEKGEYYDDGTHFDLQAADNIWTNYREHDLVLSPEANRLKLVYMRMLEVSEETNPLEFFGIPVATEEPLSTLPRVSDEERDRDETFLRQWHRQFLALYRQDPEDPMSDFFPIFVPSGPRPPDTPAPPQEQFNLNAFYIDQFIQQTVDQATAEALTPVEVPVGTMAPRRGTSVRRGRSGGGGYTGDRWQQLRAQAGSYGSYQMGGYFAR